MVWYIVLVLLLVFESDTVHVASCGIRFKIFLNESSRSVFHLLKKTLTFH